MKATRQRDTNAEIVLRRALHAKGLRFRLDRALLVGLRRRVDIVFSTARVAVFVDGCFWHSCPVHKSIPKSNTEWWVAKLKANWARDRDTDRRLASDGWLVMRIWEHEKPDTAAARVVRAVRAQIRSRHT